MPKECSQEHYDKKAKVLSFFANGLFAVLPKLGIHIHRKLFREDTRIDMEFTKSDDYNQDWLERTNVGRIPAVIIIISVLVLSTIITVYKYLIEKTRPQRLLADLSSSMPLQTKLMSQADLSQLGFFRFSDDQSMNQSETLKDTSMRISNQVNINKTLPTFRNSKDMSNDSRSQLMASVEGKDAENNQFREDTSNLENLKE